MNDPMTNPTTNPTTDPTTDPMKDPMNDPILDALRSIRASQGDDALCDARRLAALLADALRNQFRGECDILVRLLAEGLPRRLLRGEALDAAGARFLADHVAGIWLLREDAVCDGILRWHELILPGSLSIPPGPASGGGGSSAPAGAGQSGKSGTSGRAGAAAPDPDLLRRAGTGDADAQLALGDFCAANGDHAAAAGWFRRAAETWRREAAAGSGPAAGFDPSGGPGAPKGGREELTDALLVLGKHAWNYWKQRR